MKFDNNERFKILIVNIKIWKYFGNENESNNYQLTCN